MKRNFLILVIFFVIMFTVTLPFRVHAAASIPTPPKIKILLVPGHDSEVWGAQFGTMKEADMTLALATKIYNILKKDKRFDVRISRDTKGYTTEFADYFKNHEADITSFLQKAKDDTQNKIKNGTIVAKATPPHINVTEDIATKLYGFNKWADENKMDAVIHVHFNDYPRPTPGTVGKYTGFAVYMPEGQLPNWLPSGQLAASIFTQLRKTYTPSTYPAEVGGLVPDQKLIAMGANGTLSPSVRSVLIEYGYIYEKKFQKNSTRTAAYDKMASETALGIQNYFFKK